MPLPHEPAARMDRHESSPPLSTEITIAGPCGDLAGTLMTAAGSLASVLIIPGSGPTDRDGNNPLGVQGQTYKLLAEGLAQRAISSLRIDKRGMYGSRAAIANPNAVSIKDYVEDVLNWSGAMAQRLPASGVWLAGHSEGALIALVAAARNAGNPLLHGLILMAAPGHPLGSVLKKQILSNPANADIAESAIAIIDLLEAGQRIPLADIPAVLQGLFHPEVQGFLISLMALDPAKLIEGISVPVLILQGKRDLQVSMEDALRLKQHQPNAVLEVFELANHLMKEVPGEDRAHNLATYSDPALPLVDGLVDSIARFIAAH